MEGSVGFRGADFFAGKGPGWGLRPYAGINYDAVRHSGYTVRITGGTGYYAGSVNVSQAGTSVSGALVTPSPGFGGKLHGYTFNLVTWGGD